MPDIKGAVTKKVGPLPLWGWAVAGVAAVFVVGRFKGGGSSSTVAGDGIKIPTLTPGSPSDVGGGAVGSPGQNAGGGMDTQPGGAPPWWSTPPPWWSMPPQPDKTPILGTPGAQQSRPPQVNPNPLSIPGASQVSPTAIAVPQPPYSIAPGSGNFSAPPAAGGSGAGATGYVNPNNKLVGYGPGGIPIFQ